MYQRMANGQKDTWIVTIKEVWVNLNIEELGEGKSLWPKEQKMLGWPDQAPATRFQARSITVLYFKHKLAGRLESEP